MRYRYSFKLFITTFIFIFAIGMSISVVAQVINNLRATNTSQLVVDTNTNGLADGGDIIEYTVQVANCGGGTISGASYQSDIDPNTSLVPNSLSITSTSATLCGGGNNPPPPPPPPPVNADAIDDAFNITNGTSATGNLLTNDTGQATLSAVSFGDTLANVSNIPADGVTPLSIPTGGGTIEITITSAGAINITSVGTTGTGTITLFYQITSGNATTDTAQISITYGDFPVAVDDTPATLGAGAYVTPLNTALIIPAGTGLLNNDALGNPIATLTLFGGGDASAGITTPAGNTITFGTGGSLLVNADGSFTFTPSTGFTGDFDFSYIINNGLGTSTANVIINIQSAPTAQNDSLVANVGAVTNFPAPTLFNNNGSGADDLGFPLATVVNFGGGSLGGAVTDNLPGATTGAGTFAGGTLTVNVDGSLSVNNPTTSGTFTFLYRIQNAVNFSDATVTITINQAPVANDDTLTLIVGTSLGGDLNANNGNGADFDGVPAYNSLTFGGGDLPGTITTNTAPATVGLAGGTLTINLDGTFTFNAPATTGVFTFQYRLTNATPASDDATVTITVTQPPTAQNDSLVANVGAVTTFPASTLFNNNGSGADNRGFPLANVTFFGGGSLGGTVTDNLPGATTGAGTFAGGTLTVNADGSLSVNNPTTSGTFTFVYRLENSAGSSDATVTITIQQAPIANDDTLTLIVGTSLGGDLNANNGSGADFDGVPAYNSLTFGGGDLPGTITTNNAPATVGLAGGTLTINLDGTFTFNAPATAGVFTFQYRLTNATPASDDATVTITVTQPPTAQNDSLVANVGAVTTFPALTLFNNNGSGADNRGLPLANVTFFGGGSLGGTVTDNLPGVTTGAGTFAGGTLTVNADGSLSVNNPTTSGTFTFVYRLENSAGSSDATVTITIQQAPIANDDNLFLAVTGILFNNLTNNNGFGVDFAGVPAFDTITFGGGSLGGLITDNIAPASVPFAGGTLTINASGGISLVNPTVIGLHTFNYRLLNSGNGLFDDATVTFEIRQVAVANDDANLIANVGVVTNFPAPTLFNDNGSGADVLGFPVATLVRFGGGSLGGTVTDNVAGVTTGAGTFAGGTLTVNADGSFSVNNPTSGGTFTFQYRIQSGLGTDDATVTVTIQQAPIANDDNFFLVATGTLIANVTSNNGFGLDFAGVPAFNSLTFGGGSLGGLITDNIAPASVPFAGGTLTINASGSISLVNPTVLGIHTFQYRLSSALPAFDDATVTFEIRQVPTAQNDSYSVVLGSTLNVPATGVMGNDNRGFPLANVTFFGGGNLGGAVTDNAAGATDTTTTGNISITLNGDGSMTVNAGNIGAVAGDYTFIYRIQGLGSNDAFIFVQVQEAPIAQNDALTVTIGNTLTADLNDDNGSGADNSGFPAYDELTFGGGSLGGTITSNTAPATLIPLAGGTLDIALNGAITLTNPTTPGTFTFDYRLRNSVSGLFDDATVAITVNTVPDVANDDGYTVTPHLTYTSNVAGLSVRDNDNPITATITNFGSIASGTVAPNGTNTIIADGAGGTVIMNADGTFIFYPEAGDNNASGTATFFYTLTGGDTAQVTLTFEAEELVWFVDSTPTPAPFTCTAAYLGTQACPSADLATVSAVDSANDVIFIDGGSYTCGITLEINQTVIGNGSSSTLSALLSITPVTGSDFAPYNALNGADPTLTSAVADCFTLSTGNTIRGLTIGNTGNFAGIVGTNYGTFTLTEVIDNGDGQAIILNTGTANVVYDSITSTSSDNSFSPIRVTNSAITAFTSTGGTSITNPEATGIYLADNTGSTFLFGDTSITRTTLTIGAGVFLGDGSLQTTPVTFNSLTISNSGGTGLISNEQQGTITVTNSTGSNITVTNGPAINVINTVGTTPLALNFTNISATSGTTGGIVLNRTSGTLSATGGTLNTGGNVVGMFTSTVNLTYGGNVTSNAIGYAVNIDTLTNPGAVTLSGTTTATNFSNGISIQSSTRPVTFGIIRLGTSLAPFTFTPISLAGNTGAVALGDVDIFTNNANGLVISYSNASPGAVSSTDGNIFSTGNAVGLFISHATTQPINLVFENILAPDAGTHAISMNRASGTFTVTSRVNAGAKTTAGVQISNANVLNTTIRELDVTGANIGVSLSNNTGSSFTITGDGDINTHSNGFGGTMQNITTNAFFLSNVSNITLNDVFVNTTGSHGISGTGVVNITLDNLDMVNIGNGDNEHAIYFGTPVATNVTGTFTLSDSDIGVFVEHGVYIENLSGSLTANIANSRIENNVTPLVCGGISCSGWGVLITANGTATINATIQNNQINRIDNISVYGSSISATSSLTINVLDNIFTANPYLIGAPANGNMGILLVGSSSSTLNFEIDNNQLRDIEAVSNGVIAVLASDDVVINGAITNNTIEDAYIGNAITVLASAPNVGDNPVLTVNVSSNTIPASLTNFIGAQSLFARANGAGGSATLNITATNNTFQETPTIANINTVFLRVLDTSTLCMNVSGNTVVDGSGIGSALFIQRGDIGMIRLQGIFTAGPAADANATTLLNGTNTLAGGAFVTTTNTITPATCATPSYP